VGPRIDLSYNRSTKGSTEIVKAAYKSHHAAKEGKKKNVEIGQLGQQLGRVHMQKQDFNQMALAKLKGLGKRYNPNSKRKADDDEDEGSMLSDDFSKGEQRSKKRAKALPAAYTNSIISE
jgi:ribosome production factor 2